jgi:hypothetical protein
MTLNSWYLCHGIKQTKRNFCSFNQHYISYFFNITRECREKLFIFIRKSNGKADSNCLVNYFTGAQKSVLGFYAMA